MKLINPHVLRQYLDYRGMSYQNLADRAGCSKSLIGHLATGERKNTNPSRAKRICKALDVPIEALFLPELSSVHPNARRTS